MSERPISPLRDDVGNCFERFCLTAGIEALQAMLEADATELCGERHARSAGRVGYRWGTTQGKVPFHGGNIDVARPRVRTRGEGGRELELPTWAEALRQEWLGKWAMNLMLINVSTRKIGRAVRLPEDGLAIVDGVLIEVPGEVGPGVLRRGGGNLAGVGVVVITDAGPGLRGRLLAAKLVVDPGQDALELVLGPEDQVVDPLEDGLQWLRELGNDLRDEIDHRLEPGA